MPRYKLTIAYEGTAFHGWQRQELTGEAADRARASAHRDAWVEDGDGVSLRTVQGVVQRAVREVVREPVEVVGASRTDSGVHARGQVAAFTCSGDEPGATGWPRDRGVDRLARAINGRLPEDAVVVLAEDVTRPTGEPVFDPVRDARAKAYSYTVHLMPGWSGSGQPPVRPIFERRTVYVTHGTLDVHAMGRAAAELVGEHDFAGFAAAGHGRLTTVRRIDRCDVSAGPLRPPSEDGAGGMRVRIAVEGNGFLYNMVRIIAGTLVEVGRGRMSASDVIKALASGDRRDAGPTLPSDGLCLEWIRYPGER